MYAELLTRMEAKIAMYHLHELCQGLERIVNTVK